MLKISLILKSKKFDVDKFSGNFDNPYSIFRSSYIFQCTLILVMTDKLNKFFIAKIIPVAAW